MYSTFNLDELVNDVNEENLHEEVVTTPVETVEVATEEPEINLPVLSTELPTSKAGIEQLKENIVEAMLNNDKFEPLQAARNISVMENLIKSVKSDSRFKDVVLNEASKRSERIFEENECQYSIREVGVKYDYSGCNHTEYEELLEQKKELDGRIKDLEGFLRKLDGFSEVADATSGEILNPPVKTSTTIVAVTLKK